MSDRAQSASRTLSEASSKELLGEYGVRFAPERTAATTHDAVTMASELGYPVVVKLNGVGIAHKTERGLVRLALSDAAAVEQAARELLSAATADDGQVDLLVAPMLHANRELIAGLSRDGQFGMTILLGVGGVLAEAIADVSIRLVPIERHDAEEMIEELAHAALFDEFRGEPAVDRRALCDVLLGLSVAAVSQPEIVSADVNPLMIVDGLPVAVDALVEVER